MEIDSTTPEAKEATVFRSFTAAYVTAARAFLAANPAVRSLDIEITRGPRKSTMLCRIDADDLRMADDPQEAADLLNAFFFVPPVAGYSVQKGA